MTTFFLRPAWCVLLLFGFSSQAMEFGLDLSNDHSFRPTAAFAGILADNNLPSGAWTEWRMEAVKQTAEKAVVNSAPYSKVLGSSDVFDRLGDSYGALFACRNSECFRLATEKLNVHVLLLGKLAQQEGRVVLRWVTYSLIDGQGNVEVVATAGTPRQFQSHVVTTLLNMAKKTAVPLAMLKVKSQTPKAQVFVGERMLGACPFEGLVAPGEYELSVRAPGYLVDQFDIQLQADKEVSLEANLVMNVPAPPADVPPGELEMPVATKTVPPKGKTLFQKPGLYVTVLGVAGMATAAGFGLSAQTVRRQLVDNDNDGALDITRRRALAARQDALLSTILWIAGGAATATGATLMLWPEGPAASASVTPQGVTFGLAGEWQ